ncbi:glycosyltransferase 87 family protein [Hymenobacter sp. 15J16-1T3B]|uniref:glycosyltransferase 87 family protein n=1 Tax=Hymenobacter sp. 15J16-1T3B TaxID=2886941 RepID=UPI001D11363D|nr:glycosyltransferase 87 family protein [Hymenobacter sp. 15J16-1T3B]MCC3156853.1 glycosyltransferase 87 family protein [Hymenobacter sp. 15J16-1T3B]
MSAARRSTLLGLAAALLTATQLGLAYFTPRPATAQLLTLFGLGTLAYAALLHYRLPLRAGLLLALLLRLLWLPATPALSDDYHRFRWDGALVAAGHSPFLHRPDEYRAGGGPLTGAPQLTPGLYQHLNSPHYYSVYPPVCQALFGLAVRLFPASERAQIVVLRLALLLAEAATALLLVGLLRRFGQDPDRALLYLLHPLVVAELVGNLHFEAVVIAGVLAACWLLARGRLVLAAGALALGVAAKLTPLLALPLLLRRLGWGRTLRFGLALAASLAAAFAPFASAALLRNIGRSLDLYFHSFEFNASVYYLLRAVGYWLTGYNEIARLGTALAAEAAFGVLVLMAFERRPTLATLPRAALLAFTLYYLLATTVHPWYLTPLVALNCFTGWRYPATWAALATLSYATYRSSAYQEHLGLVALEYLGVLLAAAWDWRRHRAAHLAPPAAA